MNKFIFGAIFILCLNCFEAVAQNGLPSPENLTNYDKAYEEYLRKLAEVQAKNKKITENNEKINQALREGTAAYNNKNYQLAIEKFDEGINLDPDFWGTAPVLLNNKAFALKTLGAEKYNEAIKSKNNSTTEANRYFLDAVFAQREALKILETSEIPSDENLKSHFEKSRLIAAKGLAETYKLLVLTDESRIYEAIEAFENYIKIEADEFSKQIAEKNLKELKIKYKITY